MAMMSVPEATEPTCMHDGLPPIPRAAINDDDDPISIISHAPLSPLLAGPREKF